LPGHKWWENGKAKEKIERQIVGNPKRPKRTRKGKSWETERQKTNGQIEKRKENTSKRGKIGIE
jgi:hypothetical protein